jgi:hypothetical protein
VNSILPIGHFSHTPALGERLDQHLEQGDEVRRAAAPPSRYTQAPVVISIAPSTVTFRFVPGVRTRGRAPCSVQLPRTCGSRFRWVSSSASTTDRRGRPSSRTTIPATTWSMVRVTARG